MFLAQVSGLGAKLGSLLFQLPPGLAFDAAPIRSFFGTLRACFDGSVVCEPRHPGWFTGQADDLFKEFRIARVAADPTVIEAAGNPGDTAG